MDALDRPRYIRHNHRINFPPLRTVAPYTGTMKLLAVWHRIPSPVFGTLWSFGFSKSVYRNEATTISHAVRPEWRRQLVGAGIVDRPWLQRGGASSRQLELPQGFFQKSDSCFRRSVHINYTRKFAYSSRHYEPNCNGLPSAACLAKRR